MYYEEAIFKRHIKEGQNTLKDGTVKKTISERVNIKGLSKNSNFEDNEEIIIIKKKDFIDLEEKEKNIKELETIIKDLEEDINYLKKQENKNSIPAIKEDQDKDIIYNVMFNNAIETAIKIISSRYNDYFKETNEENIKEVENIIKNVRYDVVKQNNKIKELQNKNLFIIDNLNKQIADFNKEFNKTSRFKLLFNKDKFNLNVDNSEIMAYMEQIMKIDGVNIANSFYLDNLFNVPGFNIDVSEVKESIENELKQLEDLEDNGQDKNNIIIDV